MTATTRSSARSLLWRAARVAARIATAVSVTVALLTVVGLGLVRAHGDQVLTVLSGSMTPTFRTGDAVLLHPAEPSTLRVGQIVSFHAPGSPKLLTTHRIYRLRPEPKGLFLQTKGDANAQPDPDFTPVTSVVGVLAGRLPHAGFWLAFYQSPFGRLAVLGAPLLLLAAAQLISTARHRRLLRQQRACVVFSDPTRPPSAPPVSGRRHYATLVAAAGISTAAVLTGALLAHATSAVYTAATPLAANTFGTGNFCVTASTYAATIAADLPLQWYRLGEASGTVATDSAAVPTNGTYRGSPTLGQPGAIKCDANNAVRFDGSSSYVSTTKFYPSPTVFTLESWFSTTSVTGGRIIGFGNAATGASGNYDRHLYLDNAGHVIFGVYPGSVVTLVSPATYNDGQWHLADATFGAGGMALYVDGVKVGANAATVTAQSYSGFWRVGYDNLAGWTNSPTSNFFKGNLDEPAVYPLALTAAQVTAHYTANHY